MRNYTLVQTKYLRPRLDGLQATSVTEGCLLLFQREQRRQPGLRRAIR